MTVPSGGTGGAPLFRDPAPPAMRSSGKKQARLG